MRFSIPAWLGSLLFHLLGFLLILLFVRTDSQTRGAPGAERSDSVGIVLKSESEDGSVYQNAQETFRAENQSSSGTPTDSQEQTQTETELSDWDFSNSDSSQEAFSTANFLPKMEQNVIGPTSISSGADGGGAPATRVLDKIGTARGRPGTGSEATVGVFGLQGTGHKFAFVFDRSDSMSELGGKPIQAAKAELIQALDSLKSVHQLIVVFYNETPAIYPPAERAASLIYATDDNKEAAKNFIRSIVPVGNTDHERALRAAIRCNPDVIFLLTDGESKDDLSAGQLESLSRAAGPIQINVIQFGLGPEPKRTNRLKILAHQNFGLHQYINMRP